MNRELTKREHYQALARYYTNFAILKRLKASVHLEDKEDQLFWESIFKYYFPKDKFHFISYSKSHKGNETSGSSQCLAYKEFLNKHFVICIDSDYRYLLQESDIDIQHFIFQTYTYSFENHLCFSRDLSKICELACGFKNLYFDFEKFFADYSSIIYDLFVWHISCINEFTPAEFVNIIFTQGNYDAKNQSKEHLSVIFEKVETKLRLLEEAHPEFHLENKKTEIRSLGVNEENAYLYVRGHNLLSLCIAIGKDVCNSILSEEKEKCKGDAKKIKLIYDNGKDFKDIINQHILFEGYPEMNRIKADMEVYASLFKR